MSPVPISPHQISPTQFNIGFERTQEPLVNISLVKGHLALLHAFADLKKHVEGLQEAIPQMPADLERRWAWFVALAVERFDVWCHKLQPPRGPRDWNPEPGILGPPWQPPDAEKGLEVTLPPLDVMMVWHAYMLNPMYFWTRWYAEDCMRIPACQVLKDVGIPLANALDGQLQSILSTPPSQGRLDFWLAQTALPFDHVHYHLAMMTPEGSGYLQQKFSTSCSQGCTAPFARESIKRAIRRNAKSVQPSFADIIKYAEFSLEKLKAHILTNEVGDWRRITARILSAYNDDKAYSVELLGAVLRQGSFVTKMYCLGWTGPVFFDSVGDELVLQHAISRYHASYGFISYIIIRSSTLDIDLAWHTHQLMFVKYKADCTTYVRRFVDRDDKVEGLRLSSAFDKTCEAWQLEDLTQLAAEVYNLIHRSMVQQVVVEEAAEVVVEAAEAAEADRNMGQGCIITKETLNGQTP
ncbi:hypothetical protein BYT27DRAFT_7206959 [Phlegmacium glaucopus]|nr:hypothetical protein BYT27DRAFT_7206959 [Phlegmacium glaucopus]